MTRKRFRWRFKKLVITQSLEIRWDVAARTRRRLKALNKGYTGSIRLNHRSYNRPIGSIIDSFFRRSIFEQSIILYPSVSRCSQQIPRLPVESNCKNSNPVKRFQQIHCSSSNEVRLSEWRQGFVSIHLVRCRWSQGTCFVRQDYVTYFQTQRWSRSWLCRSSTFDRS